MPSPRWMILCESDSFHLVRFSSAADELERMPAGSGIDPDALANQLAESLRAHGYAGEPVLVGLDATKCLCACVPLTSPQQARQRQAMVYQLEEWLPLSAEDVVADFVTDGPAAFAVAASSEAVKPLIEALEARGVVVQSISPTALLALQFHAAREERPAWHAVVWKHESYVSLFAVNHGKPQNWWALPAELGYVIRQLKVLSLEHTDPLPLFCYDLESQAASELRGLPELDVQSAESLRLVDAAAGAAGDILAGECEPWIELRRDALGSHDPYRPVRRWIHAVAAAAGVFVLALTLALTLRAYRFDRMADKAVREERTIYERNFSGERVPVGIRSRMESELAQLAAVRGVSEELPSSIPALVLLHQVLASLPDQLRYRLLEVRLEEGQIHLDGEVRSHGDAETITAALRGRGFDVQPPPTERLPTEGVSVRISGALSAGVKPEIKKST